MVEESGCSRRLRSEREAEALRKMSKRGESLPENEEDEKNWQEAQNWGKVTMNQ